MVLPPISRNADTLSLPVSDGSATQDRASLADRRSKQLSPIQTSPRNQGSEIDIYDTPAVLTPSTARSLIPRARTKAEHDDRLPSWWKERLVPEGNLKLAKNATMRVHCAPGIKYAYWAVLVTIILDITFFVITVKTTHCVHGQSPKFPMFHLFGLFSILVLAFLVPLEMKTLGYTLIPYFSLCKPKVPFFNVSFPMWLLVNIFTSVLNHWFSVSEGIFAAVAIRETQCNEDIRKTWAPTIASSMWYQFSSVLGNFEDIVVVFWGLTFLHQLWAFLETMQSCFDTPWQSRCCTAEHRDADQDVEFALDEDATKFTNMLRKLTTTGDALHTAGETAHLATIQCQGLEYPAEREKETRRDYFKKEKTNVSRARDSRLDVRVRCLTYIRHLLVRALNRVFLNGILRGGLQVNLNVTLLAIRIHRSRTREGPETGDEMFQAALFVVVSFIAMIGPFTEGIYVFRRIQKSNREWKRELTIGIIDRGRKALNRADKSREDHEQLAIEYADLCKAVERNLFYVLVALCIITFIFGYAIVKLIMMVFFCESAMWNMTGCVPFGEDA